MSETNDSVAVQDNSKPSVNNPPSTSKKKSGSTVWILLGCVVLPLIVVICILITVLLVGGFAFADREVVSDGETQEDRDDPYPPYDRNIFPREESFENEDTEDEMSEAADDDSWTFPAGAFDSYTYERFVCDGYAGFEPDSYFIDIEYPDSVTVTTDWREVGDLGKCDLLFSYESSRMAMQYNVGEAYPINLESGYVNIYSVGDQAITRSAITLEPGGYVYSYISQLSDSSCMPSELIPDLAAPCASPIHPFLPGASMLYVSMPETLSETEREDVVTVMDDLVKRMHGGEL